MHSGRRNALVGGRPHVVRAGAKAGVTCTGAKAGDRLGADTSREPASLSGARSDRYEQPSGQRSQGRRIPREGPRLPTVSPRRRSRSIPIGPNLVARLKGTGAKRPLLLLAHTDVVGVQRDKWPVDPFGAVLRDGYVWGRGTTDDKDNLTANLMAFLLAKRAGTAARARSDLPGRIRRGGRPDWRWHPLPRRAALRRDRRGVRDWPKVRARRSRTDACAGCRLPRARSCPGGCDWSPPVRPATAPIPRLDNPVTHLASAVQKIGTWNMPMRLNDTTRLYFEKLATISTPERAARYRSLVCGQRRRQRPSAISPNTNPSPQCRPAHVARADDAPSRLWAERHSLDGRGSHRHPRRCPTKTCRVSRARSPTASPIPRSPIVPLASPRPVAKPSPVDSELYQMPRGGGGEGFPRRNGPAEHDDRRHRHGAAASQGRPRLRDWTRHGRRGLRATLAGTLTWNGCRKTHSTSSSSTCGPSSARPSRESSGVVTLMTFSRIF